MASTPNTFKQALRAGRPQIGLWLSLADPYSAEMLAGAGFDWLLVDGEHAPNDLRRMLATLQAIDSARFHLPAGVASPWPVVRPVIGDTALIKQVLEIGAQTILLPMVETAEQAQRLVAAVRYPPRGNRGVGSSAARSSRWSGIPNYAKDADEQICLLVQAETVTAMANLEAIAAVEGIDGVFFGPADLSASMGLLGQTEHPQVKAAIDDGIRRVRAAGKAPGVLTIDQALARHYLDEGALFVAVGVEASLLARAARDLAAAFAGVAAREAGR
jgi:4-hydroxy-2-oxoheptanedioate aldolase